MDSRYLDLAEQLVRHSTSLKKGEKILLDLVDTPEEMGVALIRAVRERKGIPFVRLGTNRLCRELLMGCLLYTSPSPRDKRQSHMPSSA